MSDTLEEHDGNVSVGGSNIANLRTADNKDDINALAEKEQDVEALAEISTKPAQSIRWRSVLRRPN